MEKTKIKSVFFKKLKGLHDVRVEFLRPLTAIMGVNGSGKTTIIHALSCIYRPTDTGNGENHKFPEFFVPNTDALWNGSEFHVVNEVEGKKGDREVLPSRVYRKNFDRWSPRYDDRPKRNLYYIGIDTCLPEIEKNNVTSRIIYTSSNRSDKASKQTLEIAAYVLNKDYITLIDNEDHSKHFLGVSTRSGLTYSSLSMGTGEQRTIKIIEKALSAEPYSLILIDEIDLLLHVCALRRLVEKLYQIAESKHLQIVFTTHSLEMFDLQKYVGIQYINALQTADGSETIVVHDKPSSDLIRNITGCTSKPISIYVGDDFSKAVLKTIIRKYSMSAKINIIKYGAAANAFTCISGVCMAGQNMSNVLAVLDGDVYRSNEEKETQIKKVYSGTEQGAEEKRAQVLSCISQYALPDGVAPEEFLYNLLIECHQENEIIKTALCIRAVDDKHRLISQICDDLQESMEWIVGEIVKMVEAREEWKEYISPIEEWLKERINV